MYLPDINRGLPKQFTVTVISKTSILKHLCMDRFSCFLCRVYACTKRTYTQTSIKYSEMNQ